MPERANIKLASVATGVPGVSGRAMPAALAEGETDPKALAELARGRVREKTRELQEALRGLMGSRQRFMLVSQLAIWNTRTRKLRGWTRRWPGG